MMPRYVYKRIRQGVVSNKRVLISGFENFPSSKTTLSPLLGGVDFLEKKKKRFLPPANDIFCVSSLSQT